MKLPTDDNGGPHFLVFLAGVIIMGCAVALFSAFKTVLMAPPAKSSDQPQNFSQSLAGQEIQQQQTIQSYHRAV